MRAAQRGFSLVELATALTIPTSRVAQGNLPAYDEALFRTAEPILAGATSLEIALK